MQASTIEHGDLLNALRAIAGDRGLVVGDDALFGPFASET